MKKVICSILGLCLCIVVIIVVRFITISNIKDLKEAGTEQSIDKSSILYIERENDVELIDTVNDIIDNSSLVIEGTIIEIGETEYISFVNEELEKKFVNEGKEPAYYADIWTYYTIEVDKVLYGECDTDKIIYRCLGGKIDNVVLEQELELVRGDKYVFYLEEQDGVYINSLNDNAVTLIEDNKIIENNIEGNIQNQYKNLSEYEEQFENLKE